MAQPVIQPYARSRRRTVALAGLMIMLSCLAGCGFHLQGRSPLPDGIEQMSVSYHNAYTVGDPALVTALRERLRRQGALGEAGAPAALDIVRVARNRRTIAVSPVDGDSAVYELSVQVTFNYSVNGKRQLSGETLTTEREYSADATQRLSADDERDRLLTQMQQDLANRVLARIARLSHDNRLPVTADRQS